MRTRPSAAAGRHARRRNAGQCARGAAGKVLGSLEVGKRADLLVLDTQRAHLVPAGRIVSAWTHNGQPSDIDAVMVDGQFDPAQSHGAHDGRGPRHRGSRQGRAADLKTGADSRPGDDTGPIASALAATSTDERVATRNPCNREQRNPPDSLLLTLELNGDVLNDGRLRRGRRADLNCELHVP
jgi:hypothetical protein